MFDSHVHSSFSTDSNLAAETACFKALESGLEGLIFTDHVDIDYPRISFMIDFDARRKEIKRLKDKFKGKLKILDGLEAGMQSHVMKETGKIIYENDFDFVIASIHLIDRLDPYDRVYYEGKTKDEAYGRYLEEMLKGISTFDDFDILGHLDFIIRFAPYEDKALYYKDFPELFDRIFLKLASSGKGIEVNTGSYRKTENGLPTVLDISIFKRFKELGGEIVTVGSDSHSEEFLGYGFDLYLEMLQNAGFKYVTHFESRRPIFERI